MFPILHSALSKFLTLAKSYVFLSFFFLNYLLLWLIYIYFVCVCVCVCCVVCVCARARSLFPLGLKYKGAKILGARSPWRLNFVWWCRKFVGPQYSTCCMLSLRGLEKFYGCLQNFGNFICSCCNINFYWDLSASVYYISITVRFSF